MRRIIATLLAVGALSLGLGPAQAQSVRSSVQFSCKTAGVAQLDPVVVPDGGPSAHEHTFAGNTGVPQGVHDYDTAIVQGTTCKFTGDTGAYWAPTLRSPTGALVPVKWTIYYDSMTTDHVTAFPPDFGMVWGANRGLFTTKSRTFYGWTCDNNDSLAPTFANVDCRSYADTNHVLTLRTFSPFCWDGVTPAGRDYGAHVSYPVNWPSNDLCPAGYVTLPRIRVNVNYQTKFCPDCVLASDMMNGVTQGASAHVDFWNTWSQSALEGLVAQLNGT
jgi:hypothetical protein